jgi:hypothetical protein
MISATNNIDSPADFRDFNAAPVGGAVVTIAVDLGLLGGSVLPTTTSIANVPGFVTALYRGSGGAAAAATATASTPGASTATGG